MYVWLSINGSLVHFKSHSDDLIISIPTCKLVLTFKDK